MDSRMNGQRDRISPQYHNNINNNNNININNNNNNNNPGSSHHSHSNSNGNRQSSSPPYMTDNGIKSDSPSRKRRRVSSRMPSQSPPSVWEHRQSPRNMQNQQQIQQQNISMMRRARLPQRSWETIPSLFQQTPTVHHQQPPQQQQHQASPTLMVDMNQVPVSLPLRHEPIWTYSTGPQISISSLCTNHPPPPVPQPPHLSQCHVHSVYPQPFAQNCGIGGHYAGFTSTSAQLAAQMQSQPHPSHYTHPPPHPHMQRPDNNMGLDSLDQHHVPAPQSIHVSPLTAAAAAAAHMHSSSQMTQVSTAQPIFISTENRPSQMDLIHRHARRPMATQRRNYARIHWPTQPPHHHSHTQNTHNHHAGPIHSHRMHQHHHHHQPLSHQPLPLPTTGIINSGILLNFL